MRANRRHQNVRTPVAGDQDQVRTKPESTKKNVTPKFPNCSTGLIGSGANTSM